MPKRDYFLQKNMHINRKRHTSIKNTGPMDNIIIHPRLGMIREDPAEIAQTSVNAGPERKQILMEYYGSK